MPTLFPPDYPYCPDAPLTSFGPSFSEEISRSVIGAVWSPESDQPPENDVRVAAALTMLEAFHPRDHLECMMAAQGVACHAAMMECLRRAMNPETGEAVAIKLRANATQLVRAFSVLMTAIERRQTKPLPRRPGPDGEPLPEPGPPEGDTPTGKPAVSKPRVRKTPARTKSADDPADMDTRPDGTPGSLSAYAPQPPDDDYIPKEPAIMMALALRPKPWRMVNALTGETADPAPVSVPPSSVTPAAGIFAPNNRFPTGDALARFTSTRLDPDAPPPPPLAPEESEFELELLSTGGDPELEHERATLAAAHPEGRPVITIRHAPVSGGEADPEKET